MQGFIDHTVLNEVLDEVGPDIAPVALQTFIDELENEGKVLEAAAADGDFQQMRESAHRLKSSAASFGALPLSKISELIEHSVRKDKPDQALAAMASFRTLANASLTELQALL
jgi:HPt (histidine-containing phosphotransfer) domain-containing protein